MISLKQKMMYHIIGMNLSVHVYKKLRYLKYICIMVRHISFDVLIVYLNKQWLSSNLVFLVE